MRTMMVAALLTAACGSVTPAAGTGSDTGSDMGSGSGSAPVDTSCSSAADCTSGMACDVTQHTCVAAAFTLDKAGFIDDGTRWWTNTGDPTLHGTIDNPGVDPLTVLVGTTAVGTATITGTTWSIALPANAITEADTRVVLRMGNLEQSQLFALDDQAPAAMLFGQVHDERGDQIDFSTGEAVHTHAGTAIDLAGTGCPAIYKYAYLMDDSAPVYGREAAPNPLAWQIKVSDATPIDGMDSAYRVRDASGRVLYDWTSIAPDGTGVYAVTLYRNKIPQLGTQTGQMHVDVRFRDAFGNESTTSACWENHPMAAPLEIGAMATGELFGWTLPADSPVSDLLNGNGAVVYSQRIVQHAAEPITIDISTPAPTVHYTMTAVDDIVADTPVAVTIGCSGATDPACNTTPPADPADKVDSGSVQPEWFTGVVDEVTGQRLPVCFGIGFGVTCTIPARSASEAPHAYRIEVALSSQGELTPPGTVFDSSAYSEYTFLGLTYTGLAPSALYTKCSTMRARPINGVTVYNCIAQTTYPEIRALDKATLAFPAMTEAFKTSPTANGTLEPVAYAGTALTIAAKTWNAGDDDLPGPQ